ncbi:hypothetical protein CDAR_533171 [Caerostris darwini]|uniref:K Homology domain-containing protein n=1 Tax=Caerostris darwini TaxID=1538125 RepID=A0AAV4VGB3_9ARAC|nr:hypothetical protein CDAR_533171 [Caerostris darwini]
MTRKYMALVAMNSSEYLVKHPALHPPIVRLKSSGDVIIACIDCSTMTHLEGRIVLIEEDAHQEEMCRTLRGSMVNRLVGCVVGRCGQNAEEIRKRRISYDAFKLPKTLSCLVKFNGVRK